MKKNIFLFFSLLLVTINNHAQSKRPIFKFGNVTEADLSTKIYSIDSNAQAAILFNKCDVKYEGNNSGYFNVVYKYHKRIHIISKNAFDLATVYIPLYKYGLQEDKLEKLEAVTYNLENGSIKKTKIDKGSVFKDKIRKNATLYKFTFPDLKEGSIIEYTYTVSSPTPAHLRTWEFQEEHPTLWSEYNTQIPSIYAFLTTRQGYNRFALDTVVLSNDTYYILFPGSTAEESSTVGSVPLTTFNSSWAMKNTPALKKESFTTTTDNHISKISFTLQAYRFPNSPIKPVMGNWKQVSEDLLKDEDYGGDLSKSNNWLDHDIALAIGSETDATVKAKKIFEFVRDNFVCTDYDAIYLSQPLKKVQQTKKGNVVDVNLLLVAMYQHAGYVAKPVILSTRDNGYPSVDYPLLYKYNYTICSLELNGSKILLDASQSKLGFGKLPSYCYNGEARTIDPFPAIVNLPADSAKESQLTSVFIVNDEKGGLTASISSTLGNFASYKTREQLVKQKEEDFFNDIKKQFSFDIKLTDKKIENLTEYESPIKINYGFSFQPDEDIIYFNPLLTEAMKNNPFVAEERLYPVEMPYTMAYTYILNMQTPAGYEIDELPKSTRVKLNETEGIFEYLVSKTGDGIQLRTTIKIYKANFINDDYQTLRDFYGYIVKKHSEQIVYKKKK